MSVSAALTLLTVVCLFCSSAGAEDQPAPPVTLECDQSMKAKFAPNPLTRVLLVRAFRAGDTLPDTALGQGPGSVQQKSKAGAELCLVKLLVGPGNPGPIEAASTSEGIGIEIWLPAKSAWNGRLHAIGNGGWAGTEEKALDRISVAGASDRRRPSEIAAVEGAITATSDTGHSGGVFNGNFSMSPDGTPNRTLWEDFSFRGIHEQIVEVKALALAYYGRVPRLTYWDGGSTGGRQAMKQAQMYPDDFDGIVAGYPALNWTRLSAASLYPGLVVQRDLDGEVLTQEQLNLVSNRAIGDCDQAAGQHLGFILDPSACRYNPAHDEKVLCTSSGGHAPPPACLTLAQANAVNKIWYGMSADGSVADPAQDNGWSPTLRGKQRWYGPSRGTSLLGTMDPSSSSLGATMVALELHKPELAGDGFVNASGRGRNGWRSLTYAQLQHAYDRGLALQADLGYINTDDPDLGRFKAHGGKIILFHGLNDPVIPAQGSVNYYERVVARMGNLTVVQDFMRLYLIPGMSHGPGNGTSNPLANPPMPEAGSIYQMLTDWVEKATPPSDGRIMHSQSDTPAPKSLPMCAYPRKPTYLRGDPYAATSYNCS